jgi:hypothetical protein
LPARSFWPGHNPAQDSEWLAVGNRLMSVPISASMVGAARTPMPGMVASSRIRARKLARPAASCWSMRVIAASTIRSMAATVSAADLTGPDTSAA